MRFYDDLPDDKLGRRLPGVAKFLLVETVKTWAELLTAMQDSGLIKESTPWPTK